MFLTLIFDLIADKLVFRIPPEPDNMVELLQSMNSVKEGGAREHLRLFSFNPNTIAAGSLDSLDLPGNIKKNLIRYREKGGEFRIADDFGKLYGMNDSILSKVRPFLRFDHGGKKVKEEGNKPGQSNQAIKFLFNPNEATEAELFSLGLNRFQCKNLISYRNRGGRFVRNEDLLKVYGVDSALYEDLEKWIDLGPEPGEPEVKQIPTSIEINTADSAALTTLPGIGAVYASRIIRFRSALGGFYSVSQMMEVWGMTDEQFRKFSSRITVDSTLIRPLRINFSDVRTLSRHPYITNTQARMIVDIRSAEGPIAGVYVLAEKKVFDEATMKKISHYLSCR
jgi:DNA uptake protein ComE-like DNA-binding protein